MRPSPPSVQPRVILILLGLLASAQDLSGQEYLVDARARLDWANNNIVRVSIRYRLQPGDGPSEIPLVGLLFGGAELSGVRAVLADSTRTIELSHSPGGRVTGSISLSQAPRAEEPISLELLYDVAQAENFADGLWSWRIPVLAVTWPPVAACPATFTLEALIPAEYRFWNPSRRTCETQVRVGGEDGM